MHDCERQDACQLDPLCPHESECRIVDAHTQEESVATRKPKTPVDQPVDDPTPPAPDPDPTPPAAPAPAAVQAASARQDAYEGVKPRDRGMVDALLVERLGYVQRGLEGRVALVDEQLALHGYSVDGD